MTQTEPVVSVCPADSNFIYVSAVTINTSNGFKSEGSYITTDGGKHWSGSDTCSGALFLNHGGDPGVAVTSNKRLILTHIGSVYQGVYSHYSDNFGKNWSSAYTLTSNQPEDKGTTDIDDFPGSPFFGRVYSAWVEYLLPFPVNVSYSSNSGESWSTAKVVNNNPPGRCSSGNIKVGKNGYVYICWAGVSNLSPFTENFVGFASSSDGGVNWQVNNNIFNMHGINGTLPSKNNIRVNGLPQMATDRTNGIRSGYIYIVTTETNSSAAGSDPDIIFRKSSDNGITWSQGTRVNQDSFNNGKIQYFPSIDVDKNGNINVIYYDDRNTSSDSAEVFISHSTDGGITWIEQVLSDHRFKPKPIAGGASYYQGDHISLTSAGDKIIAFWMDDFSGTYQVWTKIIPLFPTDVKENDILNYDYSLEQNYPNPFNPATHINYSIPRSCLVNVKIYDVMGKEITELVNAEKPQGNYTLTFNAANLPSGVYFCKIKAGIYTKTTKMVLLK
ncbi:MAG: T9SS type A sorting domain-containing protein [Bacteroidota bacterium]|nr:T9SS type A sorting domain-containing protein [Bacteroidota bacterium]